MQIITNLNNANIEGKTAIALGNFDGIHIGHVAIMEEAIRVARANNLKSLCFTFSNHPFNFITDRREEDLEAVKLICTDEEKIELTQKMGFDILVNIPFDEVMMKMRAHEFFEEIILGKLGAKHVSIGFNYSYGARAEGKPETLAAECEKAGIGLTVTEAVKVGNSVVSSTLIREMISSGNMEDASLFLGRHYSFEGRVTHGKKLGSKNGFPTINIPAPRRQMLPPDGVYFSRIEIEGKIYRSISNLGVNPTVSGGNMDKRIETYIFDFDEDVYGDDVTVYFDHFHRPEMCFDSKEELFAQIASDCEKAIAFHGRNMEETRKK